VYKLNRSSRERDDSVINTLGPYAVALTQVIESTQQRRHDKIIGDLLAIVVFIYQRKSLTNTKLKNGYKLKVTEAPRNNKELPIIFCSRNS
jgi:hypothetical protein